MTDPHSIPLAIYEGFVVFGTIKHTQKSPPVGIYEGFGGSKWTKMTPRGHPIALCLGLAKTAQTLEHLEHLRPLSEKGSRVFRSRLLSKKDNPRTPRTVWGIQRGKGGKGRVRGQGGGFWQDQGSKINKLQLWAVW